jgi:hypothetical protein
MSISYIKSTGTHFCLFSSCTDTEHDSQNVRSANENQPRGALKKFKSHHANNDDNKGFTEKPPAYSGKPVPKFYMFEWSNDKLRDCVNVIINLSTGSPAHKDMSNIGVNVTLECKSSSLRLTYKWNEAMVEVEKMY